jgi:membrane-associated phospholipid phosphatase
MSLWQTINYYDTALLRLINLGTSNPFFDAVLPFVRDSMIWLPLYTFLFILLAQRFGMRVVFWFSIVTLTILISDTISSSFLKNAIGRIRPCRDDEVSLWVHLRVVYCPRSGSFTSSHACNHFAFAHFFVLTTARYLGKWVRSLYVWAGIICFAQIYVGVHYPLDIVGGSLLGLLIGKGTAFIFNDLIRWEPKDATANSM